MIYSVELDRRAVLELQESYQWYEDRSNGLGQRFIQLVDKKITEIARSPEMYSKKKGNYREALIDIFPYVIIYEIYKKKKVVFIYYIFHTKRNPRLKYKR